MGQCPVQLVQSQHYQEHDRPGCRRRGVCPQEAAHPGRRLLWGRHSLDAGLARSAPVWAAERVVFLNDVYFCARDVVRLLSHDADIACGLDFDRLALHAAPRPVRRP